MDEPFSESVRSGPLGRVIPTFVEGSSPESLLILDSIDDWDDDGDVFGGVVEDVGDVVLEFLFERVDWDIGRDAVDLDAEVVADFADELFGVVHVDEAARDDVRELEEFAGLFAEGQDDDEDTFGTHVEAVLDDGFLNLGAGVVVEPGCDRHAALLAGGFVGEELDDVAVVGNYDVVALDAADVFGHFGVVLEHVKFAVVGHVILGLEGRDELDVVLVVGVAREVERAEVVDVGLAVLEDLGAFAEQSVDCADDVDFIAWNWAG